jgi:hypothetical protein
MIDLADAVALIIIRLIQSQMIDGSGTASGLPQGEPLREVGIGGQHRPVIRPTLSTLFTGSAL